MWPLASTNPKQGIPIYEGGRRASSVISNTGILDSLFTVEIEDGGAGGDRGVVSERRGCVRDKTI